MTSNSQQPRAVIAAQVAFVLLGLVWIAFAVIILLRLPGGPVAAWIIAALMLGNACVLLWLAWGIGRRSPRFYYLALAVVAANAVLSITDQVGIYDIVSLIALFSINACMNLFGLLMEAYNQNRQKVAWSPYIFGTFAGLIPWVGISIYLVGAGQNGDVPSFVYWIFLTIAITFFSFAFNMILQYRAKGRWADYLFGEKVYMILSLVAKTALAWQVFAGTLRPL